jgi:hypothetical protein
LLCLPFFPESGDGDDDGDESPPSPSPLFPPLPPLPLPIIPLSATALFRRLKGEEEGVTEEEETEPKTRSNTTIKKNIPG